MTSFYLPNGWHKFTLPEIAELRNGGTPSKANNHFWNEGTVPFVTAADLTALYVESGRSFLTEKGLHSGKTAVCEKGDLLIGTRTRVGNSSIAKRKMAASQDITRARFKEPVVPEYFCWFFRNIAEFMAFYSQGTSIQGITRGTLNSIEIPVPPLKEQRRIVAWIEELSRRAEEARKLRHEAAKEVALLFQTELERVFAPQETRDWDEHKGDQVFYIVRGQVDPREDPYIDMPHVAPDSIEGGTGRLLEERIESPRELHLMSGKYHFNSTHVLYSKIRPNLRKVALPHFEGTCSADVYPLIPSSQIVTREFLALALLSIPFTQYAIENSDRNAMPKINRPTMFGYRMKLPKKEVQQQIALRVDKLQSKAEEISVLQSETEDKLATFVPAILSKAFRGEL